MRQKVIIGEYVFDSKKKALEHYKRILNKYDYHEKLSDIDFHDVLSLSKVDSSYQSLITRTEKYIPENLNIVSIQIARIKKYNTKCFELVFEDTTTKTFSYVYRINQPQNIYYSAFLRVCRSVVQEDLRLVKQQYFDQYSIKGQVKCQETKKLSKWEKLVVDHRQPNTFSMIIDRFIEINNIDITKIEYVTGGGDIDMKFRDSKLAEDFKKYHKEKALLRIVRKECNSSRTSLAKSRLQNKDLVIK